MKTTRLVLLFSIIFLKSFGQDSLWKKSVFNDILTLNLPSDFRYTNSSAVKVYGGELNKDFFGFQYYDTIFLPIENENQFQLSLTGFISGRVSDPALKRYNVLVVDTSIGETKGLMAKFTTSDISETYKQIYYYVTLANNHYYWFYVYSPSLNEFDEIINFFFKSILFDSKKLKEKSFKLTTIRLSKNAG